MISVGRKNFGDFLLIVMMIGLIVWLLKLNFCYILCFFKRKVRESGYLVIYGLFC